MRRRPRPAPGRRVVAQVVRLQRAARAGRRVGVGRVQSAERRPVKRRRPHLLEHEVGVATDASPAVRSAPASLRRAHSPLFMRWHGVGVGVDSAPASALSGVGQSVGPGLGTPCSRRRRRGRRGPRRGRRFQVQVPARPRVSAEITVCRVRQPSALLTRRAQLHDSLGNLRVHGVLGYGSKHALWLWSAPSPTFEQMMHGPSSAPEAVRRVRHGGWRRREAVGGLAPASSGSWLVL